jgi:hypothetical protein
MTPISRSVLPLIATSLLFGACESLPTDGADTASASPEPVAFAAAPAERTVHEAIYDLADTYFFFGCNDAGELVDDFEGEMVRMEGSIFERYTLVRDGAGGYHTTVHTMPVGLRGVGETSGEEFRVLERSHGIANQRSSGRSGTYRQELKLTGRTTHRTFWLVFSGNYTIGADDEIIVERDRERIECRV